MATIANQTEYGQFQPTGGSTLACTTSSGRVALVGDGPNVRVCNPGSVEVYVAFGDNTVTATTASTCVLPGTAEVLSRMIGNQQGFYGYLAGITAVGSVTIQASTGSGF